MSFQPLQSFGSPPPQLVPDLGPELLDGNLRLEDPADALFPLVLEQGHLAGDVVLPGAPLQVDEVDVPFRGGELGLEALQLGLELVVGEEPGVAAVALEQGEVGGAEGEVGGAGVGAAERGEEEVAVRGVLGGLEGLVAG